MSGNYDFWGSTGNGAGESTSASSLSGPELSQSSDDFYAVPTLVQLRNTNQQDMFESDLSGVEACSSVNSSLHSFQSSLSQTSLVSFAPSVSRNSNDMQTRRYNDGSQLIIRHLDPILTESHLAGALRGCGMIQQMKLKADKNFPGRKFAYVTFSTINQAQNAVNFINSSMFMPGYNPTRRPQANMYDPNCRKDQSNQNMQQPTYMGPQYSPPNATITGSITKEILMLHGEVELPHFYAIILSGEITLGKELSKSFTVRKPLRDIKIGKTCLFAEIGTREVKWHLAKIRLVGTDDFSNVEVLYPKRTPDQIVFNGLLFETEIKISKCALANVELSRAPLDCVDMMKNFLNEGNRGYIQYAPKQSESDILQVQLYKTFECSGIHFASLLETLGYCKINNRQTISNGVIAHQTGPTEQNLKCTYTIFRPILDHKCSVKICHIEKWPVFYLQIICKPFFRINEIESILQSRQSTMKSNPRLKPGSLVVSNFNDTLHRGIVVENLNNQKYLIYYLDWGNRDYTTVGSVERPTAFWEIPAMAIPCKVENWQTYSPKQQESLFQILSSNLSSGLIMNEVEFRSGPSERVVLRDFVKSHDPASYAYTVKLPNIEEMM